MECMAALVGILMVLFALLFCIGSALALLALLFAIGREAARAILRCLDGSGRERSRPRAPVTLRVRGCGVGRCAYCHDDVAVEDRAACAACLALHHEECWDGRCAACAACLALRQRGSSGPSARPEAGPRAERIARR
jgi:hypothetical protein